MYLFPEILAVGCGPGATKVVPSFVRALVFVTLICRCVSPGNAAEEVAGLKERKAWTGSHLEGTGSAPMPYVAVEVFAEVRFDEPLCMVPVPGDGGSSERFVILERKGLAWTLSGGNGAAVREPFLDLAEKGAAPANAGGGDRRPIPGLGMVFHRDYPEQPYVFVSYNVKHPGGATNGISRFRVKDGDDGLRADPASETVIIEWESDGHNGCDLKWGPDGYLYFSAGDGESPGDPENIGQTVDNLLGSILRIDVDVERDGAEGGRAYRVPEDNPFVGMKGVRPEIWAYGLRNPWRMNFRPGTDELWVGDNGDEHWEMVHLVRKGENHGWSAFEGNHPFRLTNTLGGPVLVHTPPVVEHPHSEMRSVVGGLFYRGKRLEGLRGHYLYGCYFTQKLWAFSWDGAKAGTPRRIADVGGQIVSFAEDREGEPIVVALDGKFFRLEPAPGERKLKPVPELLSETGLFASTEKHQVAGGFLPYGVNAPAWWNGAERKRFFAMPVEGEIQIQATPPGELAKRDAATLRSMDAVDRWQFPEGSAFVQTFFLGNEKRRVETQVSLVERGEWRFLTYAWNEAQTDAQLVPEAGLDRVIEIREEESGEPVQQKWRFLGRAECAACHTQRSMFVLGMTLGQQNRDCDYGAVGGGVGNQLATYEALGLFGKRGLNKASGRPRLVDPLDDSADLDERARTYLHVNCAHCHRETGLGGRAEFQLLHWLMLDETKTVGTRPLVGLPGVEDARIIAPGHPERSEIYRRMATEEMGRMPLVGRERVDVEGLELIRRWIEGMREGGADANPSTTGSRTMGGKGKIDHTAGDNVDAPAPAGPISFRYSEADYPFSTKKAVNDPGFAETASHPMENITTKDMDHLNQLLSKIDCPILMVHSDEHWIKHINFEVIVPILERAGKDITVKKYTGFQHGFYWSESQVADDADAFMRQHIKVPPKAL